jgi:hypothetical protein
VKQHLASLPPEIFEQLMLHDAERMHVTRENDVIYHNDLGMLPVEIITLTLSYELPRFGHPDYKLKKSKATK